MEDTLASARAYFAPLRAACVTIVKAQPFEGLSMTPPTRDKDRGSHTKRFYVKVFPSSERAILDPGHLVFHLSAAQCTELTGGLHTVLWCEISVKDVVHVRHAATAEDLSVMMQSRPEGPSTLQCGDTLCVRSEAQVTPLSVVTLFVHPHSPPDGPPHTAVTTPPRPSGTTRGKSVPQPSPTPRRSPAPRPPPPSDVCPSHGIPMRHFCVVDKVLVCAECVLEGPQGGRGKPHPHGGHSSVPIEVRAQYVLERRSDIVTKEGELLRYLQTAAAVEARQGDALTATKDYVDVQFQVLHAMLDARKRDALVALQRRHTAQVADIRECRATAEASLAVLRRALVAGTTGEGLESALTFAPVGLPRVMDVDFDVGPVANAIRAIPFTDNTVAPTAPPAPPSTTVLVLGPASMPRAFIDEVGALCMYKDAKGGRHCVLFTTSAAAPHAAVFVLYHVSSAATYEADRAATLPQLLAAEACPVVFIGICDGSTSPTHREVDACTLHDALNEAGREGGHSMSCELRAPVKQGLETVFAWLFLTKT